MGVLGACSQQLNDDMKPTIEKIVFNIHGKKIELSQSEAKELKMILSDLFGETKVIHEYPSWPYHHWNYPWTYSGIAAAGGTLTAGHSGTISNALGSIPLDTVYLTAQ